MSLQFKSAEVDQVYTGGSEVFPGGGTAMTLSAWVYLDSHPGAGNYAFVITKVKDTGGTTHCFSFRLAGANSQPYFIVWNQAGNYATAYAGDGEGGTLDLSLATWYQIVGTAVISEGTLIAKLYVDGTRRDHLAGGTHTEQGSSTSIGSTTDGIYFGLWKIDENNPFDGRLEDAAIWERELSAAEIAALNQGKFRANHRAFLGGLKMYWPLDHPSSGFVSGLDPSLYNHTPFYGDAKLELVRESVWSSTTPGLTHGRGGRIIKPPWFPDGCIQIYGGVDWAEDIDYTTPVARRAGSGTVEIEQTLEAGRKYYFAARQVSKFGRSEQNRNVVVEVELDDEGTLLDERPDRVRNVSAAAAIGGTVEVRFSHSRGEGTKPVLFNIYYDKGSGRNQIDITDNDCKLGTVTAHGNGRYLYTTTTLTDAAEYWFAATAEDADGNESKLSQTAGCRADATAPAAVTDLAAETVL